MITQIEGATGLNKSQIINYAMYGGVGLVMLGVGQVYITTTIGVLYPAFMSFVALESAGAEDDKMWLTYWVVYGTFQIIDEFGSIILSLIPFYFFLKLVFLVWMMHPATCGARWIYDNYLSNFVKQYRAQIEAQLDKIEKDIGQAADKVKSTVTDAVKGEKAE